MKLWLDENCSLDLSPAACKHVEEALRHYAQRSHGHPGLGNVAAELDTAANVIRAHLQHLPRGIR